MPIEIRELHIRVSVDAAAGGRPASAPTAAPGTGDEAHRALVAECVEQVLQVLREQKER